MFSFSTFMCRSTSLIKKNQIAGEHKRQIQLESTCLSCYIHPKTQKLTCICGTTINVSVILYSCRTCSVREENKFQIFESMLN
jgi:hypothetical protein